MIPNEIKIIPKINIEENSNITKSLTPKYYSNNLLAYENEHSDILLETLDFDYDDNISSINIDFLKILNKVENKTILDTTESKKIISDFSFTDYQIKKYESLLNLDNLVVIDGNSFSSTTDIDYLIIDYILYNYITKSSVDGIIIYVHNLNLNLNALSHTYHGCKRNLIERIYADKNHILEENIKLVTNKEMVSSKTFENTTNTTWMSYKLTTTSKVTDIEGFEYVDSTHFKAIEKLEIGYKILNQHNMAFIIVDRLLENEKYTYIVSPLNISNRLNSIYHELDNIDINKWTNTNKLSTQEDKITHRLLNHDYTNLELKLNEYNAGSITIKMRVYSNGVWNKESDYFYILANGKEIIRLYQGGNYPIIKSTGGKCRGIFYTYNYISNIDDLYGFDWTKNTNTDSRLYYNSYRCSASYGWHVEKIVTSIFHSVYKDISITIPYEEYINLTIGCNLSRDVFDNIDISHPEIGANMSVDFNNVDIIVNNPCIKKQAKNTYKITNHKLESIEDISTEAISVEYKYPYIKEEFNIHNLIGDTYEFKVIKESEDSFENASIETYTKNAFLGDSENQIKTP